MGARLSRLHKTEIDHAIVTQKASRPAALPQAAHVRAGARGGRCGACRDLPAVLRRARSLARLREAAVPAAPLLSRRADRLFRARSADCVGKAAARGAKAGDRRRSAPHRAGNPHRMDRAPQRAQADRVVGARLNAGRRQTHPSAGKRMMGVANAQAILQMGHRADYDAFISYSHAQHKPVAAALQAAVQRLGKPWYRRRALRIFRDDTSLSATPHLWPSIEEALARSRYLILLVSPQSAASQWVGKEIAYWLEHKSVDTLLLALTEGELAWDGATDDFVWSNTAPLPPALKGRFTAEPKWVDVRDYRAGTPARKGKFLDLSADLAATIHGMPKEDLLSQEVRQQRRALTLAWSAAASLFVLAGAAAWQWRTAQTQRAKAETALNAAAVTADHLVYDLAIELRHQPGMPVDRVLNILGRAETMQRQLAQANATTPTLQHLEATSLEELSHTLIYQGAIAGARDMAERAVAIEEDLLKADPANPKYQRELAVALNELGDADYAAGNYAPAEALFTRALAMTQKLADAAPDSDSLQDDLATSVGRIFAVQIVTGRETAALDSSTREIAILEKLAVKQPDNRPGHDDLSGASHGP